MAGILSVSRVAKHFGGIVVLDGIDMEVGRGSIHQLIGPNGSGKTTLVNVITGLVRPDGGTITFDGTDITGMDLYETHEEGLVRTWQIPKPFRSLTVIENLLIPASNPGESFQNAPLKSRWRDGEQEAIDGALAVADTVGLAEKIDTRSMELSGGQMKLLELGRAMMSGAAMILMDEPIAGVNPTLAHEILEKVTEICKAQGITFLIIEHRLDISLRYVDGVFAIDKGVVIAEGGPDEVVNHPGVVESYLGA